MSLVRDTVANFIGGVSQQPDKLMYPNQSKKLINYLPSPSIGLKDRPPTEHIARLCDSLDVHPLCHTIIKEDEEYEVIFTGEGIVVYDLEGNEKTVTIADDDCQSYITTTQPLKDLFAITIADYTFVLNRTVYTALTDDTFENPYPASALIFVRQGNYTTDHTITVNGTQVASYTSTSDLSTTKTNTIASNLYSDLVSNLGTTDWTITRSGSVIVLTRNDGDSFTIQTMDSNADNDLYAFYKSAESISVLPTVAPDGFILKIKGEDVNTADDYYVQFETSDGSDFGTGSWKECCAPDIQYHIDPTTLPHALIRQSDGTFSFETIDRADRGAGDEDSAPTPSFIGNTIQDVFTHKGRLAFLSVDKSIYSDTQDIFSFFKKSTLAELDTDPIDVGSNSKMVLLKHNLPFNEELLLFSETSAFSIKGGDIFSNSTASIDLTMEYPCSRYVKPVNAGGTGFFLFENGDYSRVMEIYINSTYVIDARDVTEQVPSYLPPDMYKIANSTANSLACFLSTAERDAMYVYNYYYSSDKKAQSAWSKWTFENSKILNADFHNHLLYLVIQYDDGIYLEKMNFTPKNTEDNLDYLFYLDRKVYLTEDDLTIDEDEGTTTFTLPYTPVNTLTITDENGFPLEYEIEDDTVTVESARDYLVIGNTYFNENIYAQNLKLSNFEDFKLKLQEERKSSNATVNKYLNILSKMYNLGIGDKLLTENPLTGVKKFRESNYKIRYLTREEEERMYRVMDEKFPYLKPIVVTALQTGMRRGEIFNLKWENIDFKYGFIELLETKSGKSRKIPISDTLRNIFNNLQTKTESEYVFINPETGKPYRDIHKKFHIILEEAGIKNFRFHDLRHTVATRLVEKGIDLVVVKEILGHSSIETTMRYAYAVPERKLKAIEVLNSYN